MKGKKEGSRKESTGKPLHWLKCVAQAINKLFIHDELSFDQNFENWSEESLLLFITRTLYNGTKLSSGFWNIINAHTTQSHGYNKNSFDPDLCNLYKKQITLGRLLRSIAPISMDVAIRLSDFYLAEQTPLHPTTLWDAVTLFGNWLPFAHNMEPIVSAFFQKSSMNGKSSFLLGVLKNLNDTKVNLGSFQMFVLSESVRFLAEFFRARGDNDTLQLMWNWGCFSALYREDVYRYEKGHSEMHMEIDQENDVDMCPYACTDVYDKDDNTFPYAIQWNLARAHSAVLDLRVSNRQSFLFRLGVKNERPLFILQLENVKHSVEEELRNVSTPLWYWPNLMEIRTTLPLHSSLVQLSNGLVFLKRTSSVSGDTKEDKRLQQRLVHTCTTKDNLSFISLSLCTSAHIPPVLLCGPPGSGKSSLLRELASMFNVEILELHLNGETDSRTLLGSYKATEMPGEFVWKPGPLTCAVKEGQWVLLEDVDLAPQEILDALMPLLKNRVLPLPKNQEYAHPHFRLFGTMNTIVSEGSSCHLDDTPFHSGQVGRSLLQSWIWRKVHINPMALIELEEIATQLYPSIPTSIMKSCLNLFWALDPSGRKFAGIQTGEIESDTLMKPCEENKSVSEIAINLKAKQLKLKHGKQASVRDFRKLCHRIATNITFNSSSSYVTESQRMCCILEAFDLFFGACPDKEIRKTFIRSLCAPLLGICQDVAIDHVEKRKPVLQLTDDFVIIGRAALPILPRTKFVSKKAKSKFAPTAHSLRLMESITVALCQNEPILLVGETGCGKTSIVQHLAALSNRELIVQNLSLQTDIADLLGGYRPVELRHLARTAYLDFLKLFSASFSQQKNHAFLDYVHLCFEKNQWKKLSQCFMKGGKMGLSKVEERKTKGEGCDLDIKGWKRFLQSAESFERQRLGNDTGLAFAFTKGALVEAIETGKWMLLDEINLASNETLLRLCGLLDSAMGSVVLAERGDSKALKRHSGFRLIAAMNPATDAGKKDIPASMRSRFTELYVDEIIDPIELRTIAAEYFTNVLSFTTEKELQNCDYIISAVNTYLKSRRAAQEILVDGGGHSPRYTLRTLCRSLSAAKTLILQQHFNTKRALFEGFELAFEGPLDVSSRKHLKNILQSAFDMKLSHKELNQPMRRPGPAAKFVLIKPFWISVGSIECMDWAEESSGFSKFVLTPSALSHLRRLSRAVAAGPWPILLEGPTSSGKTTLVEYLAARCGHKCVRINNHEHTDVQEYTGSYVAKSNGSLVFQEGLLVQALRQGDWVILDELNLAPSEVLEALNRLLDDNRELFLPELNETIVAHPSFRLFATQNPSGIYGGRKQLSRAFRNRFVEIHVEDIPADEVVTILEQRCECAPSRAKLLVKVMKVLRQRRSKSSIFKGKDGLITPRDLLRWAQRGSSSKAVLALEGFFLLAERLRNIDEKNMVKTIIEECFQVKIDEKETYSGKNSSSRNDLIKLRQSESESSNSTKLSGLSLRSIAPTYTMLRMLHLVKRCIEQKEPVLLVGETGCGKTSVVQLLSVLFKKKLHILNCHASTETSDIIGGLRPLRGREGIVYDLIENTSKIILNIPKQFAHVFTMIEIPQFLRDIAKSKNESERDGNQSIKFKSRPPLPATAADVALNFAKSVHASINHIYKTTYIDSSSSAQYKEGSEEEKNKRRKILRDQSPSDERYICDSFLGEMKALMSHIEMLYEKYNSLFEWIDGPLVNAMQNGHFLLLDEISLAEDAVLERLNSILEPTRRLVLAEKGGDCIDERRDIHANDDFRIFATMNPGGDFGKRELSPALRSRFTEIWIPNSLCRGDIDLVLQASFQDCLEKINLMPSLSVSNENKVLLSSQCDEVRSCMLDYFEWFNSQICGDQFLSCVNCTLSLRDVLSWALFIIDVCTKNGSGFLWMAYIHGAALTHLDGLGIGTSGISINDAVKLKQMSKTFLINQVPLHARENNTFGFLNEYMCYAATYNVPKQTFGVHPFSVPLGRRKVKENIQFDTATPTANLNLRRVLRALELKKPVLLEGSPGVGKTSLVSALAQATGHKLVRINLSEQTDISDLMGSDLPNPDMSSDGGGDNKKPLFKWCDGVFLEALKEGDWVLLDELNLATQSVLEGLNSCLDHRAQIFIPELGMTLKCPPTFRIFAAQNPLREGGGRKGLPKSFLNRFTKVFIEPLKCADVRSIVSKKYQMLPKHVIEKMVEFNSKLHQDVVERQVFGHVGNPWEFNLRDIFRWCELMIAEGRTSSFEDAAVYVKPIYVHRFRTYMDRQMLIDTFKEIFQNVCLDTEKPVFDITEKKVQIGRVFLSRRSECEYKSNVPLRLNEPHVLRSLFEPMETVARCINNNWPCLLVGSAASGKDTIVKVLAESCNVHMIEVSLTSTTDMSELIGCFEQNDAKGNVLRLTSVLQNLFQIYSQSCVQSVHIDVLYWDFMQEWKHNENEALCSTNFIKTRMGNIVTQLIALFQICAKEDRSFGEKVLCQLQQAHEILVEVRTDGENKLGIFKWVDGILVTAMEEGHWLHLKNANLCPSSVLDRLNPLMEPGGTLVMTECGISSTEKQARVIVPKKDFRLLLSMNPKQGEISRAMRNRCIEIYLYEPKLFNAFIPTNESVNNFLSLKENETNSEILDMLESLNESGIKSSSDAFDMIKLHASALSRDNNFIRPPLPPLLRDWATTSVYLAESGLPLMQSIGVAHNVLYGYSRCFDEAVEFFKNHTENTANDSQLMTVMNRVSLRMLWTLSPKDARIVNDGKLLKILDLLSKHSTIQEDKVLNVLMEKMDSKECKSNCTLRLRYDKLCFQVSDLVKLLPRAEDYAYSRFISMSSPKDSTIRINCNGFVSLRQQNSLKFLSMLLRKAFKQFGVHNNLSSYKRLNLDVLEQPFDVRENTQGMKSLSSSMENKFIGSSDVWMGIVECRLNYIRIRYIDRLSYLLHEHSTYCELRMKNMQRVSLNELSAIEISFLLKEGKLDLSAVQCQITPRLNAIFQMIDAFNMAFEIFLQQDKCLKTHQSANISILISLKSLLSCRDRLWICLKNSLYDETSPSAVKFDATTFLVQWKWLKKTLLTFFSNLNMDICDLNDAKYVLESKQKLIFLVESIDVVVFGDSGSILSECLWKKGGHPLVPDSPHDFTSLSLLREIAKSCFFSRDGASLTNLLTNKNVVISLDKLANICHPILFVDRQVKHDLLAAQCMIYAKATDEVRRSNGDQIRKAQKHMFLVDYSVDLVHSFMTKKIEHAANEFAVSIKSVMIDNNKVSNGHKYDVDDLENMKVSERSCGKTEAFTQNLLQKWSSIQLTQIAEIFCIKQEKRILHEIAKFLSSSKESAVLKDELNSLLPKVQKLLQTAINHTIWPVSDFRSYQTLMWALDGSSLSTDNLFHLLRCLYPIMTSVVEMHYWSNSFNDLSTICSNIKMPIMTEHGKSGDHSGTQNKFDLYSKKFVALNAGPTRLKQFVISAALVKIPAISFISQFPSSVPRITIENYKARNNQAELVRKILTCCNEKEKACFDQMTIKHLFIDVINSLEGYFPRNENIAMMVKKEKYQDIDLMKKILQECTYAPFRNIYPIVVSPLLDIIVHFHSTKNSPNDSIDELIAQAWVFVGILRLHLLLPPSPLDPVKKNAAKISLLDSHISDIRLRTTLLRMESRLLSGNNVPISFDSIDLLNQAEVLMCKRTKYMKKNAERRKNAAPFAHLYQEMHNFAKTLADPNAVLGLMNSILNQPDQFLAIRENEVNWQSSVCSVCNRFDALYHDYEDITIPFTNATRNMQQGLRELVTLYDHKRIQTSTKSMLNRMITSLLQFPIRINYQNTEMSFPINEMKSLVENQLDYPGSNYESKESKVTRALNTCHFSLLLAAIAKIEVNFRIGRSESQTKSYEKLSKLLLNVIDLWEKREGAMDVGKDKSKENSVEDIFKAQFPDYAKEFNEVVIANGDEGDLKLQHNLNESKDESLCSFEISEQHISIICLIHREIYRSISIQPVDDSCRVRMFLINYAAASQILSFGQWLRTDSSENETLGAHYMGVASSTHILKGKGTTKFLSRLGTEFGEGDAVDFHNDANPDELLKIDEVLKRLLTRIMELLEAFPGHPVLLTLYELNIRVRQMDLTTTSVGKALAGLEVILCRAQEWEQHASKRVAIGLPLKEIGTVVATWRKLELSSWYNLLDVCERNHIRRAQQHWPRLYKLTIDRFNENTRDSTQKNEIKSMHYIVQNSPHWVWKALETIFGRNYQFVSMQKIELYKEFFKVIDGFLLSCGAGEFFERLRLLESLAFELKVRSKHKHLNHPETLMLPRTLYSFWRHYSQFVPIITSHIKKHRGLIENKLKNEVKLAKWDEQTYYALAESSEKSYRKLSTFLKEYDEILEWRVNQILEENFIQGVRSSSENDNERANKIPVNQLFFPQIAHIDNTLKFPLSKESNDKESEEKDKDKLIDVHDEALSSFEHLHGLRKYIFKIDKILQDDDSISHSFAKVGALEANLLSDTIFHRIDLLRGEKTTIPMKQRALVDLFNSLKNHGFLSSRSAVSAEVSDVGHLFHLPSPPIANDYCNINAGEDYFHRSVVEISRLRGEVSVFGSKYMGQRETTLMISFCDHGLVMLCQQRCIMANILHVMASVESFKSLFSEIKDETIPKHQETYIEGLKAAENYVELALESLRQLALILSTSSHVVCEKSEMTKLRDIKSIIHSCVENLENSLVTDNRSSNISMLLISKRQIDRMLEAKNAISQVRSEVESCKILNEEYQILPVGIFTTCIENLSITYDKINAVLHAKETNKDECHQISKQDILHTASTLIKHSLISLQILYKKSLVKRETKGDESQGTIWENHFECVKEWATINLKEIDFTSSVLCDKIRHLPHCPIDENDVKRCLKISYNASLLVGHVLRACHHRMQDFALFYKELGKLIYVLSRIFRVLVAKGFCSDEIENSEDGNGDVSNMTFEDDVEGTGMGEGEGKNDVTEEIENEEQLLGLQNAKSGDTNEPQADEQLEKEEAEKGMEMEGDFEGDMFDIENNDNEDSEDSNENEELERELGNESSPNDNVVDEKMWNDDDNDDDSNQAPEEEKFEKDSKVSGDQTSEELRTKDDDDTIENENKTEEAAKGEAKYEEQDQNESNQPQSADSNDVDDGVINEDSEDKYEDKNQGIDLQEDERCGSMNEAKEENMNDEEDENMELDDNVDLDRGIDFDSDVSEENHPDEIGDDDNETFENMNEDDQKDDQSKNDDDDDSGDIQANAQAASSNLQPEDDNVKDDTDDTKVNINNSEKSDEDAHGIASEKGLDDYDDRDEKEEENIKDISCGENENVSETQNDENGGDQGQGSKDDCTGDGQYNNDNTEHVKEDRQEAKSGLDAPNPFRVPGDAEKFWNRKLNVVENSEQEDDRMESDENSEDINDNLSITNAKEQSYKFTKKGESSTNQTLAHSSEDHYEDDFRPKDEESEGLNEDLDNHEKSDLMKDESKEEENSEIQKNNRSQRKRERRFSEDTEVLDERISVGKMDGSKNENEIEANDSSLQEMCDDSDGKSKSLSNLTKFNSTNTQMTDDEELVERMKIQTISEKAGITEEALLEARQCWGKIENKTTGNSQRLCEKLRLVMEPLVATKLSGDYRTGKRINMKRVIGYIASGYRKDKIWLRRTKPSKRDYRILLAVDDSESMSKIGAGHMALSALATIVNGMTQLEIGDIGIASFGEEMCLIHPFGQPFTSERGVNLVSNFKFDEKRTKIALCLESAMDALENASIGSKSSLQIVFVISDGRIERDSKSSIRRLIREMLQKNILVVMIIVEGNEKIREKGTQSSITEMKEVSFENGKPKVQFFIDDYPFPYYIILKEMEALPEVLGDALRQWFELVSNNELNRI